MDSLVKSAVALGLLSVGLASCAGHSGTDQKAPLAVPVGVFRIDTARASYYDAYPATVVALDQVDLRPEVSGYVTNIYFKDGQRVRAGARLYAIDQRHYQAAYDQAVANLNIAKANLVKTQQDVDRYDELAKNDAVARQTLEHAHADLQGAKMQVAAAEANVKNAETDLRYSIIEAPFDGTIGISPVKVGSAVTAGQTLLNTVSSDNPIAVDCAIDEKQMGRFARLLQQGTKGDDSTFTIVLPDQSVYPHPGRLNLLDRAVDPQTGTIQVRVTFPNPAFVLKPGLTCNLRVKARSSANSLIFPFKAVVEQMGEYFVYVVRGNRALERRLDLGVRINNMVIARSGLLPGEEIVIDGVQKLRDSSVVAVTRQVGQSNPETASLK